MNRRSQPWKGPLFLVEHFWVCWSCSLTCCLGRSFGSHSACLSCPLCSCLAWGGTMTASLLASSLMAGGLVLFLYCSDTSGHSLLEKETDISLLILCGFTYLCPVDDWVSSAGLEHYASSAASAAPCLLLESTSTWTWLAWFCCSWLMSVFFTGTLVPYEKPHFSH